MTSFYPAVPSWRMAYDLDGSAVLFVSSDNAVTEYPGSTASLLNNESADDWSPWNQGGSGHIVVIFPELRDIDGYALVFRGSNTTWTAVAVSADTTNGVDGTWTTISNSPYYGAISPYYRTQITSVTSLAQKAIKWSGRSVPSSYGPQVEAIHLFGEPSPGENPNRLEFWHPSSDARVSAAYFDNGDVPRGHTTIKTFRIKNVSASDTANSVRVAMNTPVDASPSFVAQHQFSQNGTDYASQQTIGDLDPGEISSTLYTKEIVSSTAQLSVWALRFIVEAGSWT